MKNSHIRVNNLIASGEKFKNTSSLGIVRSIGNDDVDFEQIEIEGAESFDWYFKNEYCGIPVTKNLLLISGFEIHESLLLTSYSISISKNGIYKVLSTTIEPGNQYVYVREGNNDKRHEDDVITIFNGDLDGELYFHHIQNLYFLLTGEELEIDIEKIDELHLNEEL